MKTQLVTIGSRFYLYQKERFPIILLILTLFPAILSSASIVSSQVSILKVCLAIIASIAYLLHIRILDEERDFDHDNRYHMSRPIQAGVISRKELQKIDVLAVFVFLGIAVFSGDHAVLVAIAMLFYSYLAGREFFLGKHIRQHFFFYNAVNLIQMLLMQILVYFIFVNNLPMRSLLAIHFLFTALGTAIFEFMRKLKIPGDDGAGKDTYTWYLGFNNSLVIYGVFVLSALFLFFRITSLISIHSSMWLIFSVFLGTLTVLTIVAHWIKRTRQTDQLLQLFFLLMYGTLNLIIYFIQQY